MRIPEELFHNFFLSLATPNRMLLLFTAVPASVPSPIRYTLIIIFFESSAYSLGSDLFLFYGNRIRLHLAFLSFPCVSSVWRLWNEILIIIVPL